MVGGVAVAECSGDGGRGAGAAVGAASGRGGTRAEAQAWAAAASGARVDLRCWWVARVDLRVGWANEVVCEEVREGVKRAEAGRGNGDGHRVGLGTLCWKTRFLEGAQRRPCPSLVPRPPSPYFRLGLFALLTRSSKAAACS